jgi:hypothetical protein
MTSTAWMPDTPVVKFCQLAIDGVPRYLIVVSDWMDGAKRAVRYGKTIYLSPAMWELLVYAEDVVEMRAVWDAIGKDALAGGGRVRAGWEEPGWMFPEIDGDEVQERHGCHAQN